MEMSNMSPEALRAWRTLESSWGAPLSVISSYRDPAKNAAVKGAKNSQHLHGNAVDISTAGMSQDEIIRLARSAQGAGFTGFGGYDNSIHFDVGPSRTWGSDYTGATTPEWLRAALGRQSNTGGQRMAMQPTQRQGILGALGIQKQDRNAQGDTALPFYQRDDFKDTMGKLAVGFNSLTLRPDQNLAANVRANRQERQTNQRASQSMEWLSRQPNSEAYIEMLRAGAPVGQVLQAYQAEVSGGNAPSGIRGLRMQAEDAGLVPGTPEYQTFMLNGGGNPAAYRALVMQAKAAGYEPGTPEFERFMASRGAYEKTAQAEEARNRTDDEQQLIVMTRNLPGLYDVVDELADLASVATYTATGLAADNLARQLGQPMSEGATARAAYIATVDNQILPLLRQTFGAAFTAAEGDRLRATLGNEKGSPEEKMATLNAFIRGKQREIVALGGELPERPVAASPVAPDTPVTGGGAAVPAPGDIVDGYRFKGGNPALQSNWEAI